jgi:hypothetical protein
MSDINLDFTVNNNSINFTVEPNEITFTPSDIQLAVYSGGAAFPGGANTELQYNQNGATLGGIPSATYNGANLTLTLANTKITGGNNHYYLQTDGTGNLTWATGTGNISGNGTVGGANTQIQFNDGGANFGGNAGFTFDKVTGQVDIPGDLIVVGNISANNLAGNANYANFAGTAFNVSGSNVSGAVANATFALDAGNANLANTANSVAGGNISGQVANALIAGTVYTNAQPNITSLGNLTSLTLISNNVALANNAGLITQDDKAVAIGYYAGRSNQGAQAIAIGAGAGNISQGLYTIAIGPSAAANTQGDDSIAIGRLSGRYTQGASSIAIGAEAGKNLQSSQSVAIGLLAGETAQGSNSIAIGSYAGRTNQANNSIILNATAANLDTSTANTFNVKPIRNDFANTALYYNPTTGEITYDIVGAVTSAQTVTDNAQPNITSVGTLTSISVSGNATLGNSVVANYFTGTLYGNANTAGTVTTNAQPNITSLGTLSSVSVTGNANVGNLRTGGLVSATGNVTAGNVYANTGIVQGQFLKGDGSNITGITTVGSSINNGTSNVSIPSINGNVNVSAGGISNIVVVTGTGVNVSGTLNSTGNASISGNANIGNIGTGRILASGNITTTQLISNIATGTAPFVVTSNTQVANLNVARANLADYSNIVTASSSTLYTTFAAGNANVNSQLFSNTVFRANLANGGFFATTFIGNVTGSAGTANTAGTAFTVTTNAQPNITSVGTLTSLSVNATLTSGNANLGNLATANFFSGNANALFNIQGANVVGTVPNATTATTSGTVTTAAQPNITSLGTLVSIRINPVTLAACGAAPAAGTKRIISDALTTTFFAIAQGGGVLTCPIFSDGGNWRIG